MQVRGSCIIWGLIRCAFAACTLPREITKTPRGAVEQLLLTQALNRSLVELSLPLSQSEPLYMEVTGLQPGYLSPALSLSAPSVPTALAASSSGFFTPSWDLTIQSVVIPFSCPN